MRKCADLTSKKLITTKPNFNRIWNSAVLDKWSNISRIRSLYIYTSSSGLETGDSRTSYDCSLMAIGLSGFSNWLMSFVIGWSKYRLGLFQPRWFGAHVTVGNFHRFATATDSPLTQPTNAWRWGCAKGLWNSLNVTLVSSLYIASITRRHQHLPSATNEDIVTADSWTAPLGSLASNAPSGLILALRLANERRRHFVTTSITGNAI